jgi:hypothetical protein
MGIYNYLFYKSFILYKKSKNFDDIPVLGGLVFLSICVLFNLSTLFIFLEGFGVNTGINLMIKHKYFVAFGLLGLLLFYYSYKGRYKRIIKHYEDKKSAIKIHPVIVIIIYYVGSFGLLLLAGLFKNKDWIFAP